MNTNVMPELPRFAIGNAAPGFTELRAGNLGVRLATSGTEIDAVQALRYRVFYEEMGARADAATVAARRDADEFDAVADHLLVVDHDLGEGAHSVVGTYRLIRQSAAAKIGRFYFGRGVRYFRPGKLSGGETGAGAQLHGRRVPLARRNATALAGHRGLCVPLRRGSDVWLREPEWNGPG